jgi:hypothetical protein
MPTATTTRTFRDLKRLALAAHVGGERWAAFWPSVAADVRRMAPYDRRAYRRLVERLLNLVVSGSMDGLEPPGSEPWEADNAEGKRVDLLDGPPPVCEHACRSEDPPECPGSFGR